MCVIWLVTPSWGRDLQPKLLQGLTDSTNRDMLRYKLQCNQMSSQMTEVLQSKTYSKPGSAWPHFYKHQVVSRQLCTQGIVAVGTGEGPSTKQGLFTAEDCGVLCSSCLPNAQLRQKSQGWKINL